MSPFIYFDVQAARSPPKINRATFIRALAFLGIVLLNFVVYLSENSLLWFIGLIANIFMLLLFTPGLVSSGLHLGKKARLPSFLIGAILFPLLTSAHEMIISAIVNIKEPILAEITFSQQMSNKLFEMMVVFGVIGYVMCKQSRCLTVPGLTDRKIVITNGIFMILTIVVLSLVASRGSFFAIDGFTLIVLYAAYLVSSFFIQGRVEPRIEVEQNEARSTLKEGFILIISVLIFVYLGNAIADHSTRLVFTFDLFQKYSFLIVGMIFALPNAVISISGARKGEIDFTIGYAIGSVIWELTMSMAVLAFTGPIPFFTRSTHVILVASLFFIGASTMIYLRTKWTLHAWESLLLLACYSITLLVVAFLA